MITESQIAFYRENGYLLVEGVVDADTLTGLRQVTEEFVNLSRTVSASDALFDIGPGHSAERPLVRRVKDPHRQHPLYDQLMRSPGIVDVVAALLGPNVRFDHSKLNFKPADGAATVEWHQDWAFYPHTNEDILAVGVMLEDCTLENGPLTVIPGSHKGPVFDHHHDGYFVGAIDPHSPGFDPSTAVALTGPAGSATFHHVRMVHGSRENHSGRTRPLLLYSYTAADAWPLVENYDFDEFNSRVIRGAPTLEPRQLALPVRIPLPRLPDVDSIYDDQQQVQGRSFGDTAEVAIATQES